MKDQDPDRSWIIPSVVYVVMVLIIAMGIAMISTWADMSGRAAAAESIAVQACRQEVRQQLQAPAQFSGEEATHGRRSSVDVTGKVGTSSYWCHVSPDGPARAVISG